MNTQAIAGILAGLTVVLSIDVALLWRLWRAAVSDGARARDRVTVLHTERAACRERVAELEGELAARAASPLEGELVIVNTPAPDDQSIRGVVVRELNDGGLLLAGAVYLERVTARGGLEEVQERHVGDVIVPSYSFAQRVPSSEPSR